MMAQPTRPGSGTECPIHNGCSSAPAKASAPFANAVCKSGAPDDGMPRRSALFRP